MKYFHLIWSALFRRKTRTVFTLISIIAAFLLFGLLNSVRVAFTSGSNSLAGAERLVVASRFSIMTGCPRACNPASRRSPACRASGTRTGSAACTRIPRT